MVLESSCWWNPLESENSSWPSRAFDIRRPRDRVRDVTRRAGHGARREFPRVRRRRDRRRTRSRSRRRVAPERRRRRRGVPIPKRRPPRRVGGGCRGIVRRGIAPGAGQIRARARIWPAPGAMPRRTIPRHPPPTRLGGRLLGMGTPRRRRRRSGATLRRERDRVRRRSRRRRTRGNSRRAP